MTSLSAEWNRKMTDNPLYDFYEHDDECETWMKSRPICAECGEPIQEDYGYSVEGRLLCEECFDDYVKKEIKVDIDALMEREK